MDDFPELTNYEKGCCNTYYIPLIRISFWGDWEIDLCIPILVLILNIGSFLYYYFFIKILLINYNIYLTILLILLLLLNLISYFKIIFIGPGYFSIFHENNNLKKDENYHEIYSGIISNEKQYIWAMGQKRPNRTILSRKARRYIIRPDHFCDWTSTWIGKRNLKFFFLFNFYSLIYILIIIILTIIKLINEKTNILVLLHLFFIIFLLMFLFLTLNYTLTTYNNAKNNITTWEIWNNIDSKIFDKGINNNLIESFDSSNIFELFCPLITPFKELNNYELIINDLNYDDIILNKKKIQI